MSGGTTWPAAQRPPIRRRERDEESMQKQRLSEVRYPPHSLTAGYTCLLSTNWSTSVCGSSACLGGSAFLVAPLLLLLLDCLSLSHTIPDFRSCYSRKVTSVTHIASPSWIYQLLLRDILVVRYDVQSHRQERPNFPRLERSGWRGL
jgi:hypothetical protein